MRTHTTRLRALTLTAVLVGVAAALAATASQPASAAFPGANGKIAFASDGDIYAMNPDGSGRTPLTNGTIDSEPTWSPDGERIALSSFRDANAEIYVMNADGSGQTRLTNAGAFDEHPAWSPDGSKLAFTRSFDAVTGGGEVYVMNADGSGQTRLTNEAGFDGNPAWSPDGNRIAFTSRRDGNDEVYVMNADGSGQINLTSHAGIDAEPDWSPDGSRIAFTSGRAGNPEVYVMNADGSSPTRLTSGAFAGKPDWQPLRADLAVTVQAPETAPTRAEITYTVVVSNAGPQDGRNVVLTDSIPAGAKFVGAITTQGSCTPPTRDVGSISCNLGTVTRSLNAAVGITLKLTAKPGQTVNNVVRVSSDEYDPSGGDNVAVASTLVTRR